MKALAWCWLAGVAIAIVFASSRIPHEELVVLGAGVGLFALLFAMAMLTILAIQKVAR